MFGRKGADNAASETQENAADAAAATRTVESSQGSPRSASPSLARRTVEAPGSRRSVGPGSEERKLTVGKGLSLAGEINSCDILVVEGKVEAKLTEGKLLEITEAGQFRGNVEIENADIAGRYDGQLVVHGRLTVRATGRISGMVKYGELEISAGGQIIGELQVTGSAAQPQEASGKGPGGFKNAARFAALSEDDDKSTERKSA